MGKGRLAKVDFKQLLTSYLTNRIKYDVSLSHNADFKASHATGGHFSTIREWH